jgi:pimeloyl-ACP methyl ester carboxylesterase
VRRVRPDAEIELLDHAGHVPMVERPEQFVVALERLLSVLAA